MNCLNKSSNNQLRLVSLPTLTGNLIVEEQTRYLHCHFISESAESMRLRTWLSPRTLQLVGHPEEALQLGGSVAYRLASLAYD